MTEHHLIFGIFLIFTGAAVLSSLALLTRQSMLVAYIFLGVILGPWGPWGAKFFSNPQSIHSIGEIGIIFLLFLLMYTKNFLKSYKNLYYWLKYSSLTLSIIPPIIAE